MALRPFAKHQKKKADDAATPSAADEFAQFFSNDPRPEEPSTEVAPPAPVEPGPTVTMKEESAAGWYPDSKDPGLMRYWDGFHLTGQTMRVDPPSPPAPDRSLPGLAAAEATPIPSASDLLAAAQPKVPLLGSRLLSTAETPAHEEASTPVGPQPPGDDLSALLATGTTTAPASAPSSPASSVPSAPVTPSVPAPRAPVPTPPAPVVARPVTAPSSEPTAEGWVARTEQAVLRAQAVKTPEAWQEAAEAASVVAEMALTMQLAADVRQSAERLDEAAGEAKLRAEEAEKLAAEAQRSVQVTAQVAKEAAEAAAAAAQAATEAKQKAERAIEAMPRVTARSNDAVQAASAAKRTAQLVEEIVTRAHKTDTADAWREAHRKAERTVERDPGETQPSGS